MNAILSDYVNFMRVLKLTLWPATIVKARLV